MGKAKKNDFFYSSVDPFLSERTILFECSDTYYNTMPQFTVNQTKQKNQLMQRTALLAVVTTAFLIFIKGIAFLQTESVAVLSSFFDSVQDLLTSGVGWIAVSQSMAPPDKKHRFGYGKAQAVGALLQSFIILSAGLILLKESIYRLFNPQPVEHILWGVLIIGITLLLTLILVWVQYRTIQRTHALSIRADMAHYSGDILMNIGVICTLIGETTLGWYWLDGFFGILVAGYLFLSMYHIICDSFAMLTDAEMPRPFRRDIKKIALSFQQVRKITDLRTRLSGSCVFIQACIYLDSACSLKKADELTEMIEKEIKKKYPDTQILIHTKPEVLKKKNDSG